MTCPPDHALAAILDGADPPAGWEDHVQRCGGCQERLAALTQPVAVAVAADAAGGSAEWQRVRAWVTAHPPAFGAGGADDRPDIPGFAIESVLGRGVSGVVYAARELALARPVAIKLFPPLLARTDAQTRFEQETTAVAGLHHPHVVQVYRVGEVDGRPYLVMEFAEGASLADRMTGSPWPAPRAAEVVRTLAQTVEYAHGRGVVHRDLKPDNVLFVEGDILKVTDFGLAITRQLTLGAAAGFAVGTPGYAAPEQLAGTDRRLAESPAVDVYSLGAILYELLTGRPPFRAARPLDAVYQTIHAPPVPPARLEPGTPRDLEVICLKCLEKAPSLRYATAALLADDLRRFLVGEPILARSCSPAERAGRWARRHPGTAAGLLLILSLLVSSGGLVLWLWRSADRTAVVERAAKEEAERRTELEHQHGRESQRRNAELLLDRAIHLCERGEVESGLKAFNDLKAVLTDRDADLWAALRWNRAAWEYRHVVQAHRFLQPAPVVATAIDTRGTRCAIATVGGCRLWDMTTGEALGEEWAYGGGTVHGVRWGRDGDTVAVWGTNGARLWDAAGRPLGHVFPGAAVTAVAGLGGGRWAVGTDDRRWVVWDGGEQRERFAPRRLAAVARVIGGSPDGRHLFLGLADGTLARCDPATGETIESVPSPVGPVGWGAIAGPGPTAALAGDEQIQLFSLSDTAAPTHLLKPRLPLTAIALAAGSPYMAGFTQPSTAPAGQLLLWDTATGLRVNTVVCDGPLTELHLSADGDRLVAGGGRRRASVWLGALDQAVEVRLGFTPVNAMAVSADGRYAVVGRGADREALNPIPPFAQVWRLPPDQRRGPPVPLPGVTAVALAPDRRLVVGDHRGNIRAFDPTTGNATGPLATLPEPVRGLLPHPAGAFLLAVTDRRIHILNPATGAAVRPPLPFASPVRGYALSGDGRHLAVGGRWQQYGVWDTATWSPAGKPVEVRQNIGHVSFLPAGRGVMVGALNGAVEVRDPHSGEVRERHQLPSTLDAAALSPDGRWLAVGSNRRTLWLIEAVTWQAKFQPHVMPESVADIVWHPDGRSLFARTIDGQVRHIDAGTMRPIGPPLLSRATGLAIDPDAGTLWAANARGLTPWVIPEP